MSNIRANTLVPLLAVALVAPSAAFANSDMHFRAARRDTRFIPIM